MNGREKPSTLRLARLSQGYRLVDVAARAGHPVGHLSEVERGRSSITAQGLAAVAGALKLTDEELGRVVREVAQADRARKSARLAA